jgi:hypothetical protein
VIDFNDVTHHFLHCIHVHLQLTMSKVLNRYLSFSGASALSPDLITICCIGVDLSWMSLLQPHVNANIGNPNLPNQFWLANNQVAFGTVYQI